MDVKALGKEPNLFWKTSFSIKSPFMLKRIIILLVFLSIAVGGWYYYQNNMVKENTDSSIYTKVEQGDFHINVVATGELQAARSEKILGPPGMRAAGIFQTTISSIVPEGTLVAKGDEVAALDRTDLGNKMKSSGTDIEKAQSQIVQAQLDTAIEMRGLRDQIRNIEFSIEEKKLEAKMNIYEPPAVQRQTQLELERLERDMQQNKEKYKLKQEQATARIEELTATLSQHQNQLKQLSDLSKNFSVKAPKSGMVIYQRSWNGKKGPGSRVTAWDPVVAQLPDLSQMNSITYVNEVDISKVSEGQPVIIQVDAFPEKKFKGKVLSIANIGEQRPNFDAKVFEVKISLINGDSTLRPAMTTGNMINTKTFKDVVSIPLEAYHRNDSLTYSFIKTETGIIKKEIIVGSANDNNIIVKAGLSENQEVTLTIPLEENDLSIQYLTPEEKQQATKQLTVIQNIEKDKPKAKEGKPKGKAGKKGKLGKKAQSRKSKGKPQ